MDLSKEFLTPLINALAFLAQAASATNQFRRNIIEPKLPGWMKQLAKNVKNGPELLFGDDLNKRVKQINNTNNALLTKPIHTVAYKLAANQTGGYNNGKSTTYQHQNCNQYPKIVYRPGKALLLREGVTGRATNEKTELEKVSAPDFTAWNLRNRFSDWKKITNDRIILEIIKNGFKIEFMERPNITWSPKIPHSKHEKRIINAEIEKLLQKGVIIKRQRDHNDFVSTVCNRKKEDGSFRTILNLKCLNKVVKYKRFKMDSLKNVFKQ